MVESELFPARVVLRVTFRGIIKCVTSVVTCKTVPIWLGSK